MPVNDNTKLKNLIGSDALTERERYAALMDVKQVAGEILHVSERTVTRMCASGELKAVKVGHQWRINRDALLEYAGLA